jgi:DNA replication protein DnaC
MENMPIKKLNAEEESELKYSISLNTHTRRVFAVMNYYLGHNISLLLRDMKMKSSKLCFDIDTLHDLDFTCQGVKLSDEGGGKFQYFLNNNRDKYYDFTYDGEPFQFNCHRLGEIAVGECAEEYQILTIRFNDMVKLEEMSFEANKYYTKFYSEIDDDPETFTIFSNEESYWERISTREKRDLKYIYLPKKQKKDIDNDLINFMKEETKQRYSRAGIPYKRIYLLEGIPGAGKTSLITALASKHSHDVAILSLDPKMTDMKLCQAIKNLPKNCFLVIEDIDGLFVERKTGDNSRNCITIAGLLNSLDGIMTKQGLIAFITTNFKSNLDSALIRPGRVDYIMKFDYIKITQVKEMYKVFMEENFDEEKMTKFVDEFRGLGVNIPPSLLQQYLFKYLDNPDDALENISDIKNIKESCTTNTNRNENDKLYS